MDQNAGSAQIEFDDEDSPFIAGSKRRWPEPRPLPHGLGSPQVYRPLAPQSVADAREKIT